MFCKHNRLSCRGWQTREPIKRKSQLTKFTNMGTLVKRKKENIPQEATP